MSLQPILISWKKLFGMALISSKCCYQIAVTPAARCIAKQPYPAERSTRRLEDVSDDVSLLLMDIEGAETSCVVGCAAHPHPVRAAQIS